MRHARDVLEEVVRQLPYRARVELEHQVRALDAKYVERTLPDPLATHRQWRSDRWWRRRLAGSPEAG
ncbi:MULTISPECIES: hypothetical protein [unclassified Streptomyces]|uniref:hypothetical protein n=1 Tax=unclassified Streptomyces TaxID=2593676 RepID=UPI00332AEF18|nr:hypothetical protein OG254_02145 [Streptomyces sp. NBC_01092]